MRSRKGTTLLPEEVLKIVIAVICIGFLVFLLVSLYFSVTGDQKSKQADAVMNNANGLKAEIEKVNAGGTSEQGFLVANPSGWYIFSFTREEVKPNMCAGGNCICICESVLLTQNIPFNNWQKRQIEKCDDKGSCAVFPNLKSFEKIKIEKGGIALSITKVNGEIEISKK